MTTEWSHLPNAVHIDRIIASAKAHPEVWAAWWAEGDAARDAAREMAWDAAWYAARAPAGYAVWDAARATAGYAVIALIAWDHSAKFFDMTSNELEFWQKLSEDPAAILILPAVRAFEQIKELELA